MTYLTNMIPKHCIELFVKNFNTHPSIIQYDVSKITTINFFLEKYRLIWFDNFVNENGKIETLESLHEYDSTGIMIYLNQERKIFILTTIDRKNVCEFLINNLKKLK